MRRRILQISVTFGATLCLLFGVGIVMAQDDGPPVGAHAWVQSHAQIQNPASILGGPLHVTAEQADGGAAFWVFPGPRELDPSVFGTPDKPIGYYGAPFPLYGVPMDLRGVNEAGDAFTRVTRPTPFSDNFSPTTGGFTMSLTDATATDAATTRDKIDFRAEFQSPDGSHTYVVEVQQPLAHGFAFPFFGGVATNMLLHGISGIGTPLMPTEYTYAAFWGVGTISRDGEVVNERQLVHLMVTEPVRGAGYELVTDRNVPSPNASPTAMTVHLMIPPYRVTGGQPPLADAPVQTGVTVQGPQGEIQQPFFHVMFNSFTIEGARGGNGSGNGN